MRDFFGPLVANPDFWLFADSMNPAQERIARNFAAKVKKTLKDVQTGSRVAPTYGLGNSSSS